LKSRSSKGGNTANFNEIRFEDKKGEEQLYIHAEKDKKVIVENDRSEEVGHDETIKIGNDRTESVEANEKISIGKNRTQDDGGDQIQLQTGDASLIMKKDGTIEIKGKDIKITGSGKINIKADSDIVVKGSSVKTN